METEHQDRRKLAVTWRSMGKFFKVYAPKCRATPLCRIANIQLQRVRFSIYHMSTVFFTKITFKELPGVLATLQHGPWPQVNAKTKT